MRIFLIILAAFILSGFQSAKARNIARIEIANPPKHQSGYISCQQKLNSFAENVHTSQSLVTGTKKRDHRCLEGLYECSFYEGSLPSIDLPSINSNQLPGKSHLRLLLIFPKHYFW